MLRRLTRNRVTPPPRVLPMLVPGFAGMLVAGSTGTFGYSVVELAGDDRRVADAGVVALALVSLVLVSWLHRIAVRWWIEHHPPERAGRLEAERRSAG